MKAKLYVCVLLTALIAVFTISGCNKAPEHEPVATLDEATVDEVVISSTTKPTLAPTVATTVALTETTVGETTTATETTTEAEEVTEAVKVNNQTSDKANTSNANKTENKTSESTQKPDNTNTSGNTTSNTTTKEPSSSSNEAVVYFNKNQLTVTVLETEYLKVNSISGCSVEANNNNVKLSLTDNYIIVEGRHSGNSVITATASTGETVTCSVTVLKRDTSSFTDDTPLTFEEMNTEEMMQRMVDDCIEYFTNLGMTYNEELDPSWAGWIYGWQGGFEITAERSYNQNTVYNIEGLQSQIDALNAYYDSEYSDACFKVLYELTDKGTYNIIMCIG